MKKTPNVNENFISKEVPASPKQRASPGSAEYILENITSPQHSQLMAKSFIPGINRHFGSSPLLPNQNYSDSSKKTIALPETFIFQNFSLGKTEQEKKHDTMRIVIDGEQISLNDAINEILMNRPPLPFFESFDNKDEGVSYICPFSYTPITCPGRSVNCKHRQCFDLKEYISLQIHEEWKCPICGMSIKYDDLRYDPFFFVTRNEKERTLFDE